MRNFIAWLRYILDIEKPYSDYESDTYLNRQSSQCAPATCTVIIAGLALSLGLGVLVFA